jgi:hypothetical protein
MRRSRYRAAARRFELCSDAPQFLVRHALCGKVAGHAFERHAHFEQLAHEIRCQLDHPGALIRLPRDELEALQAPYRFAHGPPTYAVFLGEHGFLELRPAAS